MADTAIKVENLSKVYQIGTSKKSSLRESIADKFYFFTGKARKPYEDFWALKDVSFEIKRGEAVGIVGKNGAGKSTLLKTLSRITKPTKGRIEINGRIASLLEVGTGFHPELSGRENIYLNGTILGMTRKEIKANFDEIVNFSGVEKFIDTPVKHYSSGMYVRLAFAVAAHLEPEILIIDEVLAVGDAEFQKKCLGKMGEVTKEGRTVLFVSHNIEAIRNLCSTGVFLERGKVKLSSNIDGVIDLYLKSGNAANVSLPLTLNDDILLNELEIVPNPIVSHQDVVFSIALTAKSNCKVDSIGLIINDKYNNRIAIIDLRSKNGAYNMDSSQPLCLKGQIKNIPLVEGDYKVGMFIGSTFFTGNLFDLATLIVTQKQNNMLPYPANVRGYLELDYNFQQEQVFCSI